MAAPERERKHHGQNAIPNLDVDDVADLEHLEVCREANGAVLAKATREHVARTAAETVSVTHS